MFGETRLEIFCADQSNFKGLASIIWADEGCHDTPPVLEYLVAPVRAQGVHRIQSNLGLDTGLQARVLAVILHTAIFLVPALSNRPWPHYLRDASWTPAYLMVSVLVFLALFRVAGCRHSSGRLYHLVLLAAGSGIGRPRPASGNEKLPMAAGCWSLVGHQLVLDSIGHHDRSHAQTWHLRLKPLAILSAGTSAALAWLKTCCGRYDSINSGRLGGRKRKTHRPWYLYSKCSGDQVFSVHYSSTGQFLLNSHPK